MTRWVLCQTLKYNAILERARKGHKLSPGERRAKLDEEKIMSVHQLQPERTLVLYQEGSDIHWVTSDGDHGKRDATLDGEFDACHWARIAEDIIEETGCSSFEWV